MITLKEIFSTWDLELVKEDKDHYHLIASKGNDSFVFEDCTNYNEAVAAYGTEVEI